MTAISVSTFAKGAEAYVAHAVKNQDVISVTTEHGNAIVMSEEEYRGMQETLYLMNAKGMPERIFEARSTPIEESEDFAW